jgi:hypothetical protein
MNLDAVAAGLTEEEGRMLHALAALDSLAEKGLVARAHDAARPTPEGRVVLNVYLSGGHGGGNGDA